MLDTFFTACLSFSISHHREEKMREVARKSTRHTLIWIDFVRTKKTGCWEMLGPLAGPGDLKLEGIETIGQSVLPGTRKERMEIQSY